MTTYARSGNSSNENRDIVYLPEYLDYIFVDSNIGGLCRFTDTEHVIRNISQKLSNQCYSIITIDEVKYAIKETLKEMKKYCDHLKNIAIQDGIAYDKILQVVLILMMIKTKSLIYQMRFMKLKETIWPLLLFWSM